MKTRSRSQLSVNDHILECGEKLSKRWQKQLHQQFWRSDIFNLRKQWIYDQILCCKLHRVSCQMKNVRSRKWFIPDQSGSIVEVSRQFFLRTLAYKWHSVIDLLLKNYLSKNIYGHKCYKNLSIKTRQIIFLHVKSYLGKYCFVKKVKKSARCVYDYSLIRRSFISLKAKYPLLVLPLRSFRFIFRAALAVFSGSDNGLSVMPNVLLLHQAYQTCDLSNVRLENAENLMEENDTPDLCELYPGNRNLAWREEKKHRTCHELKERGDVVLHLNVLNDTIVVTRNASDNDTDSDREDGHTNLVEKRRPEDDTSHRKMLSYKYLMPKTVGVRLALSDDQKLSSINHGICNADNDKVTSSDHQKLPANQGTSEIGKGKLAPTNYRKLPFFHHGICNTDKGSIACSGTEISSFNYGTCKINDIKWPPSFCECPRLPLCRCKRKCFKKFTNSRMREICESFWQEKDVAEQKKWIRRHSQRSDRKQQSQKKKQDVTYVLTQGRGRKVTVCAQYFQNVLGFTDRNCLDSWINNSEAGIDRYSSRGPDRGISKVGAFIDTNLNICSHMDQNGDNVVDNRSKRSHKKSIMEACISVHINNDEIRVKNYPKVVTQSNDKGISHAGRKQIKCSHSGHMNAGKSDKHENEVHVDRSADVSVVSKRNLNRSIPNSGTTNHGCHFAGSGRISQTKTLNCVNGVMADSSSLGAGNGQRADRVVCGVQMCCCSNCNKNRNNSIDCCLVNSSGCNDKHAVNGHSCDMYLINSHSCNKDPINSSCCNKKDLINIHGCNKDPINKYSCSNKDSVPIANEEENVVNMDKSYGDCKNRNCSRNSDTSVDFYRNMDTSDDIQDRGINIVCCRNMNQDIDNSDRDIQVDFSLTRDVNDDIVCRDVNIYDCTNRDTYDNSDRDVCLRNKDNNNDNSYRDVSSRNKDKYIHTSDGGVRLRNKDKYIDISVGVCSRNKDKNNGSSRNRDQYDACSDEDVNHASCRKRAQVGNIKSKTMEDVNTCSASSKGKDKNRINRDFNLNSPRKKCYRGENNKSESCRDRNISNWSREKQNRGCVVESRGIECCSTGSGGWRKGWNKDNKNKIGNCAVEDGSINSCSKMSQRRGLRRKNEKDDESRITRGVSDNYDKIGQQKGFNKFSSNVREFLEQCCRQEGKTLFFSRLRNGTVQMLLEKFLEANPTSKVTYKQFCVVYVQVCFVHLPRGRSVDTDLKLMGKSELLGDILRNGDVRKREESSLVGDGRQKVSGRSMDKGFAMSNDSGLLKAISGTKDVRRKGESLLVGDGRQKNEVPVRRSTRLTQMRGNMKEEDVISASGVGACENLFSRLSSGNLNIGLQNEAGCSRVKMHLRSRLSEQQSLNIKENLASSYEDLDTGLQNEADGSRVKRQLRSRFSEKQSLNIENLTDSHKDLCGKLQNDQDFLRVKMRFCSSFPKEQSFTMTENLAKPPFMTGHQLDNLHCDKPKVSAQSLQLNHSTSTSHHLLRGRNSNNICTQKSISEHEIKKIKKKNIEEDDSGKINNQKRRRVDKKCSSKKLRKVRALMKKYKHTMLPSCGCSRRKCIEKIPEERRKEIHCHFWSLGSYKDRKMWLTKFVRKRDQKSKVLSLFPRRKNKSKQYCLPDNKGEVVEVCRLFFIRTLGFKWDNVVDSVIRSNISSTNNLRSIIQVKKLPRQLPDHIVESVKEYLALVRDSLKVSSKTRADDAELCQEGTAENEKQTCADNESQTLPEVKVKDLFRGWKVRYKSLNFNLGYHSFRRIFQNMVDPAPAVDGSRTVSNLKVKTNHSMDTSRRYSSAFSDMSNLTPFENLDKSCGVVDLQQNSVENIGEEETTELKSTAGLQIRDVTELIRESDLATSTTSEPGNSRVNSTSICQNENSTSICQNENSTSICQNENSTSICQSNKDVETNSHELSKDVTNDGNCILDVRSGVLKYAEVGPNIDVNIRDSYTDKIKYKKRKSLSTRNDRNNYPVLPPCGCQKRKCAEKFTEIQRQDINNMFWDLGSYNKRKQWILEHIKRTSIRRRIVNEGTPRKLESRWYYLPGAGDQKIEVCKGFFLRTLGYRWDSVIDTIGKTTPKGEKLAAPDKRGRKPPPHKISDEAVSSMALYVENVCHTYHKGNISCIKGDKSTINMQIPYGLTMKQLFEDYKSKHLNHKFGYESFRKVFRRVHGKFVASLPPDLEIRKEPDTSCSKINVSGDKEFMEVVNEECSSDFEPQSMHYPMMVPYPEPSASSPPLPLQPPLLPPHPSESTSCQEVHQSQADTITAERESYVYQSEGQLCNFQQMQQQQHLPLLQLPERVVEVDHYNSANNDTFMKHNHNLYRTHANVLGHMANFCEYFGHGDGINPRLDVDLVVCGGQSQFPAYLVSNPQLPQHQMYQMASQHHSVLDHLAGSNKVFGSHYSSAANTFQEVGDKYIHYMSQGSLRTNGNCFNNLSDSDCFNSQGNMNCSDTQRDMGHSNSQSNVNYSDTQSNMDYSNSQSNVNCSDIQRTMDHSKIQSNLNCSDTQRNMDHSNSQSKINCSDTQSNMNLSHMQSNIHYCNIPKPSQNEISDSWFLLRAYPPRTDTLNENSQQENTTVLSPYSNENNNIGHRCQKVSMATRDLDSAVANFRNDFSRTDKNNSSTKDKTTTKKEKSKAPKVKMEQKMKSKSQRNYGGHYPLLPPCHCKKKKCTEKFSELARQRIHDMFWDLKDYNERKQWMLVHIKREDCKRRRIDQFESFRKLESRWYFFPGEDGKDQEVCKEFFLRTLGYKWDSVIDTIRRTTPKGETSTRPDQRGKKTPVHKLSSAVLRSVVQYIESMQQASQPLNEHIKNISDALAQRKSENTNRRSSGQLAVPYGLTMKDLYVDYKDKHTGHKIGYESFRRIFRASLNSEKIAGDDKMSEEEFLGVNGE